MGTAITYSEKFEKYIERKHFDQVIYKFSNGYGASVVFHYGMYGYEDGLCEIAVLIFDEHGWEICYNTPITNDVIGYVSSEKRDEILEQIKDLVNPDEVTKIVKV